MPADRWQWVQGLAHTPEVDAVLDKQDRGDPLTSDERRILNEARAIINSEVRGWERGEPWDRDEDVTPTPAASPPAGTPVPGSPEMPPSPAPVGNEPIPADIGPPTGPLYGPNSPDDVLTLEDPFGNTFYMTRDQYDNEDPAYRDSLTVQATEPRGSHPTLARPGIEPAYGPALPAEPSAAVPPATPAATAASAPPASPPIAPIKLPPQPAINAPLQDEPPNRRPAPSASSAPSAPAATPKAPAPAPASKPAAPPASIAPPPFESDASGALLPEGRFTRPIRQAGGRPTQRVAERVGREIGEVFRPGDQGGYRGDTGGWRTLAHEAANAWEEQNRIAPNSLKQSERDAYQRDPASLHRDILKPDSPFRDYRESWIGATRVGQRPPLAGEFTEAARPYGVTPPEGARPAAPLPGEPRQPDVLDATGPGFEPGSGISQTTDRGGVPREITPQQSGPPGSPRVEPGSGISQTTDRGGVPREYTPSENTRPGAPLPGAEPPSATLIIATPDVMDISPPSRDELTPDNPYVSRQRGRSSPDLMAMMQSDANQPWPGPSPRARDATEKQATQEIVEQGRANSQSNREIAETLEMNGFGDADQWENSLDEEDMRFQQQQLNRYPPDGGGYLQPIPPPGEAPFYSPSVDPGASWADPGDELPINYDEDGYPVFRTRGGDERTAESRPSYVDNYAQDPSSYEEPSYYDESSYAEDQPQYDDQGEVAYDEPSYDYEYADEYA